MKEPNLIMKCIRLMVFFKMRGIPLAPKMVQWFIRITCSADIPTTVQVGSGTVFKHNGLGVVLHDKVIIGKNSVIMQNVTLGGRNGRGAPVLEDNVFVGCGACILGNVIVGENSMIGANAVVIDDVPKGTVVGGVPAKYIRSLNVE